MKKILLFALVFTLLIFGNNSTVSSQEKLVDEVVAIVGGNIVLMSDVETQYMQYRMQGNISGGKEVKCQILESLLFQKLLLNQAELDSVEISDGQIEQEMDGRMRYYIQQFGSQEKLEEFYQKSVLEIKEELRDLVGDQMKVKEVQRSIMGEAQITPSEVRTFYSGIPVDSLPLMNTKYQIGQIVKNPPISIEELTKSYDKIKALRDRIMEGESFKTLAILYSEDPGSAAKGGELGMFTQQTMFPEFEAAAFNLTQVDDMSEIVKTEVGYHIIQLIERSGEYINVRHILIQPKVSPLDLEKARHELDSVAELIDSGKLPFKEATLRFSDDPGRVNGGLLINPMNNTTTFESDELEPNVFFVIDKLEVGEISQPVMFMTEDNNEAFRILKLIMRTEPHRANLKDDYNIIQAWALEQKQAEIIQKWVNEKSKKTYIKISERYNYCEFENEWPKNVLEKTEN